MPATFNGRLVLNSAALNELLRGPNGPVMRDLFYAGEQIKELARQRCPVGKGNPAGIPYARPPLPPGQLRDSIVKRVIDDGGTPTVLVGSPKPYALYVHEGTQAHEITPRKRRGRSANESARLVFFWPRVGSVVFARTVNHPGTKPNRFLTSSLEAVIRSRYPSGGGL